MHPIGFALKDVGQHGGFRIFGSDVHRCSQHFGDIARLEWKKGPNKYIQWGKRVLPGQQK